MNYYFNKTLKVNFEEIIKKGAMWFSETEEIKNIT